MKTITIYLPQFHRTPENDMWWGEGFTEWTAVKAAKPLFEGHKQPKMPLNGNYYNLLEKSTMVWQADLMKQYGIDGQCIYHYYFKDGRKILEQPAENLLRWKDIDMPFCFCWANSSWTRTWSNIKGNSWADKFEKEEKRYNDGVLLEQKYGGKEEWSRHFEYLLSFFMDERYIKVEGAPVFVIYDPLKIYCLEEMIVHWKQLARRNGFPDLFIIGDNMDHKISGLDAILLHAPHGFWKLERDSGKQGVFTFDSDEMWERILAVPLNDRCKTYYEGIVNCDDTPRRGTNGVVMQNFTLKKLYDNLYKLFRKSLLAGNEFVFINAWNEWGEGMYLEPDEEYGYKYLETVQQAQIDAKKGKDAYAAAYGDLYIQEKLEALYAGYEKYKRMYNCLEKWMIIREEKRNLAEYLSKFGIKEVAVYGAGVLGQHLLTELKESSVKVKYVIDRNPKVQIAGYEVLDPDNKLDMVDAIIVTVIGEFGNICESLKGKINTKILSIEELLFESQ